MLRCVATLFKRGSHKDLVPPIRTVVQEMDYYFFFFSRSSSYFLLSLARVRAVSRGDRDGETAAVTGISAGVSELPFGGVFSDEIRVGLGRAGSSGPGPRACVWPPSGLPGYEKRKPPSVRLPSDPRRSSTESAFQCLRELTVPVNYPRHGR